MLTWSTPSLIRDWFQRPQTEILSGLVVAFAMIPEAIAFSGIAGVDPQVGCGSRSPPDPQRRASGCGRAARNEGTAVGLLLQKKNEAWSTAALYAHIATALSMAITG